MSLPVLAQTSPDAGSTLRQLEPPTLTLPRKPPPELQFDAPARPVLTPAPALRFTLKAFRITGATAFPESELLRLVEDYVGREVGITELGEAASRITGHYAQRGYPLATSYLPAQDIKGGVVELVVLEGRFGKVELRNRSRVRDGVIASYLDALPGRIVEEARLERQLLLVYDLPGIAPARAVLAPGQAIGETDLRLELDAARGVSGSLELDNYGNRFSGANRVSGQLDLSSPARLGDAASFRVAKGDPGLEYGRASYQLPIGGQGLRAGTALSAVRYQLGGSFAGASGEARTTTGFVQYSFVRSRQFNANGRIAYEHRDLQDRLVTASDKSAGLVTTTVSGDAFDAWGGGGTNAFSISYTRGDLNIETPDVKTFDRAGARTDGGYRKWNLSFVRLQSLTGRISAYVSFQGQKAGKNLDSSEKLILGGINGVRAYPQGEAAGDSGYLVSGELRYTFSLGAMPGSFQLLGFVDSGQVRLNEAPFAGGPNHRRLSGGGIGLSWTRADDFALRLAIAQRIGNSRATAGGDTETRGWLQAIKFF
jgi:hemolysin activation/secretion protein